MAITPYTDSFFSSISHGSLRSARLIAPLVYQLAPVCSVLDVGCGTGAWLRAFQECGAERILGVDGDYVDRSQMLVDRDCFSAHDLETLHELPTSFDLTICLEVLEHLSDPAGRRLVQLMTSVTPLVLFSAAIPGQGGTHHINERWHVYWHRLFEQYGFQAIDCLRPLVFAEEDVQTWYRQNVFLYASDVALSQWPGIGDVARRPPPSLVPISAHMAGQLTTIRGLSRQLYRRIVQRLFG